MDRFRLRVRENVSGHLSSSLFTDSYSAFGMSKGQYNTFEHAVQKFSLKSRLWRLKALPEKKHKNPMPETSLGALSLKHIHVTALLPAVLFLHRDARHERFSQGAVFPWF